MVVKFDIRGDMNRVIADMEQKKRGVREIAAPRAINKMADQVKVAASREMRAAGYKLKVSDIKKGLTIYRASAANLTATVVASGKPIPLIAYGAKQTARGVSVSVLNGRKVITQVFIATMPSGHTGVFERLRNTHKKKQVNGRTRWTGLPIKELFGPSIPDGLANATVQSVLQRLVDEKFPTILRQQIDRLK